MSELKMYPIDKPNVINAITCRLSHDIEQMAGRSYIAVPIEELRLMIGIIEAAVNMTSEIDPSAYEAECRGRGTGSGKSDAEDRLIREVRKDLP